ncbi:AAA family ATPase [bacterium]|jgi:anion-transporting  ArsA/GET3 family ATPase|nr:AAA family ATPase [bacterium]
MTDIVLVAGAGGVGKTTLAAGIGVAAAREGRRTLVLTVDPARRLATALGLKKLSNVAHPNPDLDTLWAAMLDAGASWEAIARRHAPPEVAERLVASPFFDAIARQFPAGAAYAASEEMAEQVENGAWDLVVVDTPPSSGGIDFLTAPAQMRTLVGGRVLRMLTGGRLPGRKTFFDRATKPALRLMDGILGGGLLQDVGDFLFDLRHTYDGIALRSKSIAAHMERAHMVLVTTNDPLPLIEADRFVAERPGNTRTPIIVFNRTLPETWITASTTVTNPRLVENLSRWAGEAAYQRDMRTDWTTRHELPVVDVPWQADTPNDIGVLETLADPIWVRLDIAPIRLQGPETPVN